MRRRLQMVFQDPYSSLNPRKRIGDILSTPLVIHGLAGRREAQQRARDLLVEVGLPADAAGRWPSQLSGGQQQRVGIARALALQPQLVVADEPVSALDVSVQAQIVALLKNLQRHHHMSLIFISHDLALVRHIADRVAVMYLGRIVELAAQEELYARPGHPYTRALLSAVPRRQPWQEGRRILLRGEVGSGARIPNGCRFHPRCWKAQEICRGTDPPLQEYAPGHLIACHFPEHIVNHES
jgi:peptide/nickel transport system ATP-binding protein/oligopeptide transport system ATP-binding protein